jgi:hypothetical protein
MADLAIGGALAARAAEAAQQEAPPPATTAAPTPPASVAPAERIGEPTPPPAPAPVPNTPIQHAVAEARTAGYSWDEIHNFMESKRGEALKAGYSDQEVDKFLGYGEPGALTEHMQRLSQHPAWQRLFGGPDHPGAGEAFMQGAEEARDTETAKLLGNVPILGRAAIGGMELAGGLYRGLQETAVEAGLPKDVVTIPDAFMGMPHAFPALAAEPAPSRALVAQDVALQMRRAYADAMRDGTAKSPADFTQAAQNVTGAPVTTLAPLFPSVTDTFDAALALAKMDLASAAKPKLSYVGTIQNNLLQRWAETGDDIGKILSDATRDPAIRQSLQVPQPPRPPEFSSTTPTPSGPLVVDRPPASEKAAPNWNFATPEDVTAEASRINQMMESRSDSDISHDDKGRPVAYGRHQITPDTARTYSGDPARLLDGDYNEQLFKKIISDLSQKYNGDPEAMMIAYNGGPKRADAWLAAGRNDKVLPLETQKYVARGRVLLGRPEGIPVEEAKAYQPTEEASGHSGAGASTPGFSDETAAPYKPPTLEEAERTITDSMRDPSDPGLWQRVKDMTWRTYLDYVRPEEPLNQLQNKIETGRPIDEINNPRWSRRLSEQAPSLAQYHILRDMTDLHGNVIGPGLEKILEPLGADEKSFWAYAKARAAMHDAEYARETGIPYDQAQMVADAYREKFEGTFQQLVNFQNQHLGLLRDHGVISPEQFDRWVEEDKAHIPLYRVDEDQTRAGPKTGSTVRNPVKERQGSTKASLTPLRAIMQDVFVRTQMALRNDAISKFVENVSRPLGVSSAAEGRLLKVELTPAEIRKLDVDSPEPSVFRRLGKDLGPNDVGYFKDGKWQVETFDDIDVARALNGMSPIQLDIFKDVLGKVTNFFRQGVVLNPLFPVKIAAYDLLFRPIVDPGMRNTLGTFYNGLVTKLFDRATVDQAIRSGVLDHALTRLSSDRFIQSVLDGHEKTPLGANVWNAVTTPAQLAFGGLKWWAKNVSEIMPVGRYVQGLKAGESNYRAATAASEFPFHRGAFGGPKGKAINSIVPFALAPINGFEQLARSAFGIGTHITEGAYKAPQFWAKGAALITMPAIANWYANKDSEWYRNLPDWRREQGLNFNVGTEDNPALIYIPLPPVVGTLFAGVPVRLLDAIYQDNPHATAAFEMAAFHLAEEPFSAAAKMAAPIPGPAASVLQWLSNYSFFTGRPLVNQETIASHLPPEQATQYTSGLARYLSGALQHVPGLAGNELFGAARLDFLLQGLGGTMEKMAAAGYDLAAGTGPRGNNPVPMTLADWPGMASFTTRYPTMAAQSILDFNDRWRTYQEAHGSLEDAVKRGDIDRVKGILAEYPGAAALHKFQLSAEGKAQVGDLPPETRAEMMDTLRQDASALDQAKGVELLQRQDQLNGARGLKKLVDFTNSRPASVMTGEEKQQLLTQQTMAAIHTAERANQLMDELGLK